MRKIFFFAATAVLAMASCTQNDDFFVGDEQYARQQEQENVIQFGTYLGQNLQTRAGASGSINTNILKGYNKTGSDWKEENAKKFGFGVFAYYTGNKTYNDYTSYPAPASPVAYTTGGNKYPNFMYNELVWFDDSQTDGVKNKAGYITQWTYALTKYWPNEVGAGAVDDQEGDTGNDPATTVNQYGGNLSFFAYSPYVTAGSGTSGITKLSANNATGDPIVSYAIDPDGTKVVDLLWGTLASAGENVVGGANNGVSYSSEASASNYEKSILPHSTGSSTYDGYTLPADLTKQKTNGMVVFAFKHALAKVGGSETYSELKDGEDKKVAHGLMVQLDIDDMKGAETGGIKQDDTRVTIVDVRVAGRSLVPAGGHTPAEGSSYTRTYLKGLAAGDFNLATGYWKVTSETTTYAESAATINHIIASDASTHKTEVSCTLNEDIAEPASWTAWGDHFGSSGIQGVEVAKKNVYAVETAPLVFIPGTYPELTIVIDYIVRTKDTKLADGFSYVRQEIAKRVTFTNPVELNKQYNLLMHLGLTSVKFDALVSDWQVNGDTNGDGIIDTTDPAKEELIVEDAYLPRNVGAVDESIAGSYSHGDTKSIAVASGTTKVNVEFTGLTDGAAFVTALTSSVAGDALTPSGSVSGDKQVVTLEMKPNLSTAPVNHTFTFRWNSRTITVTVAQAAGPLTVDATTKTFSKNSWNNYDVKWDVKDAAGNAVNLSELSFTADAPWLTVNGDSNKTVNLNANGTDANRSTVVTVKHSGGAVGSIVITQNKP